MTCVERGCDGERLVLNGVPWERCRDCAMGNKPTQRRQREAVRRAEALAPLVQPANGLAFRIPGPPLTKNEWHEPTQRGARGLRVTDKAKAWMKVVRLYALQVRPRGWSLDGNFEIEIHSVFTSPLADSSGPLEIIKDALQGVLYRNDVQVGDSRARRSPPDGAPRLEVTVRRQENAS